MYALCLKCVKCPHMFHHPVWFSNDSLLEVLVSLTSKQTFPVQPWLIKCAD